MRVSEAKDLVLALMTADIATAGAGIGLSPTSPDPRDPGKFLLQGRSARVIHHFSGWHVPIRLEWFDGSWAPPRIQGQEFYWYVFAIPRLGSLAAPHYFVCDYLQMRDWVLEFDAPRGDTHRDHADWMANIHVYRTLSGESQGYFRWGDEPIGYRKSPSRVVRLDNVSNIVVTHDHVAVFGPGGESEAHRRLKLYIAGNPQIVGMRREAASRLEYRFQTGDRVDVMFENHDPVRCVAEIEVEGEQNICVGIHQAIKYRALAESDAGLDLQSPVTRAVVAAYETAYPRAAALAGRYGVRLVTVDRAVVLDPAA